MSEFLGNGTGYSHPKGLPRRKLRGSINNKYQGRSHIADPIIFYFWRSLRKLAQKEEVIFSWKNSKSLNNTARLSARLRFPAKGLIHRFMHQRDKCEL